MNRVKIAALAALWLCSAAASAEDNANDRAAILELMDKAFAAVASGDPDDWRAIQLAEGTTLSFRPDGEGGQAMRIASNEEAIQREPTDDIYLERWIGEPTVMIRGPIAVVWGEYEFFINGERSHCGVDSVDMVSVDGEWKIANFMWTVEPDGCPDTPPVVADERPEAAVWAAVEARNDTWAADDQAGHMAIYHPDFLRWSLGSDGLLTRASFASLWNSIKSNEKVLGLAVIPKEVRFYADGAVAVAHYTIDERYRWIGENTRTRRNGEVYSGNLRFSDVFVLEDGKWLYIGGHRDGMALQQEELDGKLAPDLGELITEHDDTLASTMD